MGDMTVESSTYKRCYDIHGIIRIASMHDLPELGAFRVKQLDAAPDIIVLSGAAAKTISANDAPGKALRKSVSYDDGLKGLGFQIRIEYGDRTIVRVSRMIAASTHVLYTNVIEPLLRWTFVQKGYVLLHAACVSFNGRAALVTAKTDTGKTSTIILISKHSQQCEFLSDDMTIVGRDGRVLSYPKPMTISFHTLNAARTAPLPLLNRFALQIQSRLHSKSGRRIGLGLATGRFPAASLNAVVQFIVPPPKYMIDRLIPGIRYGTTAQLSHAVVIERGPDAELPLSHDEIVHELSMNAEDAYGFPPYPVIGSQLFTWDGEDLHGRERAIVAEALKSCQAALVRSSSFGWWKSIPHIVSGAVIGSAGSAPARDSRSTDALGNLAEHAALPHGVVIN